MMVFPQPGIPLSQIADDALVRHRRNLSSSKSHVPVSSLRFCAGSIVISIRVAVEEPFDHIRLSLMILDILTERREVSRSRCGEISSSSVWI